MSKRKRENKNQSTTPSINRPRYFGKARFTGTLVVFAASFTLYFFTLAPTVTLVDSGELILAAKTLGVAHPPGFPLYVLLSHMATLLPFGTIATRVHLASALFAALASATMTLLVIEAMRNHLSLGAENKPYAPQGSKSNQASYKNNSSTKEAKANLESNSSLVLIIAPSVIAGLLYAFSRTLWGYATIAEVYTLNALLIIVIFWLMLGWRRDVQETKRNQIEASYRKLYISAFIFGLALGVHHVTVGLMLPALAALVFSTEEIKFFTGKRMLYAALISFAGLSVYVYLPIAASYSPLMNWGDPSTLERFWRHVTGTQYQGFFDFSPSRISEFFKLASHEFGFVWLPLALALALAGFVDLFRRDKAMFRFLSLVIVADVAYCLCYEIAEDKDAYYIPAFIAITIAASFGVRLLITVVQKTKLQNALTPIRSAILLLIVPLIALDDNFAFNNRSRYFIAHDYVDNILKSIEPRGLLLTTDWQVYSPSLYVREVENQRKDTIFLNVNQLRRSWYYDYLNQAYPQLTEKSRDKIEPFLEDLRAWERNPDAYNKNVFLNQRLNSRFYEMMLSFVKNQIKDAPVYISSEIAINRGGQDFELTRALIEKYRLVPDGLVFRVDEKTSTNDSGDPQIITRGLSDGTLKFDDGDVVKKKVLPVYLNMAMNNGIYFASQGNHEKAIARFMQALAIDSTFEPAIKGLAASQIALQKQHAK